MNTQILNKTARGYWALQTLKLNALYDEPTTRATVDSNLQAIRALRTRAALPQYHARPAEVHPLASVRKDYWVAMETGRIADILRERSLILWRLNTDELRPDWVTDELRGKVEELSEELVQCMWILRRLRYRYGFGTMAVNTPRSVLYKRIKLEANEFNTFGNGDALLEAAAERLYRREVNGTHPIP